MQKSTKQSTWKGNSAEVAEVRQELGSGFLKETRPWEPRLKSSSPFSPRAFFLLFCAWLRALHRHWPACHKPEGIFERDSPFHPVFCCIIVFLGGQLVRNNLAHPFLANFARTVKSMLASYGTWAKRPIRATNGDEKLYWRHCFCHIRRRSTCSTEKART